MRTEPISGGRPDDRPSDDFSGFDPSGFARLLSSHEDWLLERLTTYVVEIGFGRYVPPLIESWRLAVAGVTESILLGVKHLFPRFELDPDDDYMNDPISRFSILEARRHRERGIPLNMFLSLLIYFRQIFTDLVEHSDSTTEDRKRGARIIERLFDRMLIAISMEWTGYDQRQLIEDLQANNRMMTNEKNKYLSIFESHPHLVFILDLHNRIDNMNHAASVLFKHARLPGAHYYQVIQDGETKTPVLRVSSEKNQTDALEKVSAEALFPWLADDLKTFSRSPDSLRGFEKKVAGRDGCRYFNVKLSRTIDAGNEIRGIILVLEDITDRKLASEELRLSKEKADRANRAKSVFLANMSHELRTPLNAILGFTRLMMKSPDTTRDQLKNLAVIAGSGENLLTLINNVLDISKIEAGHMVREDADIHLRRFLEEIKALMSIKVVEKGLRLDLILSPDLPERVRVDRGKLRQVLINLVANAVKFTEKGWVQVRAGRSGPTSSTGVRLCFEVADTGIGIRKQDQAVIFAPFEQIGAQPVPETGTGLGLAICREYAEFLDGTISVRSEPGKGSVFCVEIPVTIPSRSGHGDTVHQYENIRGVAEEHRDYRILIAEDHADNLRLLREIHEFPGFKVKEAVNGRQAVEIYRQWRPHLIWMDIRMPEMNGLEATKIIKADRHGAQTRIIAITAHALEEERLEILASGCDGFIRKPFRDSEIYEALKQHLGVNFLFADQTSQTVTKNDPAQDFLEERLAKIPFALIESLGKAVLLLDEHECRKAIQAVRAYDAELAGTLHRMVENFRYKDILLKLDQLKRRE